MINDSFLNLSILEASPDGIVVTDLKGLVVRASQSAVNMFGFKCHSEVEGLNVLNFIDVKEHIFFSTSHHPENDTDNNQNSHVAQNFWTEIVSFPFHIESLFFT